MRVRFILFFTIITFPNPILQINSDLKFLCNLIIEMERYYDICKTEVLFNLSVSMVDFSHILPTLSRFLTFVSTLEFHILLYSLWEYPTPPCHKQAWLVCLSLIFNVVFRPCLSTSQND